MNGDDLPAGFQIVPAASSSQPPPSSRPATQINAVAGPSHPPSKKLRADSQPPPAPASSTVLKPRLPSEVDLERDVREMDNESDSLRRNARATGKDPAPGDKLKIPVRTEPRTPSKSRDKIVETSQSLPLTETPQIERNKLMRGELSKAGRGISREPEGSRSVDSSAKRGHRRRSSISGKRISDAFQASRIIRGSLLYYE